MNSIQIDMFITIANRLEYPDILRLALTQKRFSQLINETFWSQKGQLDYEALYSYWRFKVPFSTLNERQYNLWLYSQKGVTYGSEQFKSIELCLTRAINANNTTLIDYFVSKGANYTYQSIKALITIGRMDLLTSLRSMIEDLTEKRFCSLLQKAAKYNRESIISYLFEIKCVKEKHINGWLSLKCRSIDKLRSQNRLQEIINDLLRDYGMRDNEYDRIKNDAINLRLEYKYKSSIILGAIQGHHDELLEKYRLGGDDYHSLIFGMIYHAAKRNYQDYLKRYLVYDNYSEAIVECLGGAIIGRQDSLVNDILEHRGIFFGRHYPNLKIADFIKTIIRSGNLSLIQKIYENIDNDPHYRSWFNQGGIIDTAFIYGHREILEYLVPKHNRSRTKKYIYYYNKIKRNHWEILQSSYDFLGYDCDKMGKSGHKDVIWYFEANPIVLTLTDEMKEIIYNETIGS